MTIEAGQQVGSYEILEVLSRDMRGCVCRATCRTSDRDRVIKGETVQLILFNRVRDNGEACARFERLAGILLSCSHDHMVRYLDAFKWQPLSHPSHRMPCLVMEDLQGSTLTDYLATNKKPVSERLLYKLLHDATAGFSYAQQHGLLPHHYHPGQVFILEDETIKVMGFGEPTLSGTENRTLSGTSAFFQLAAPECSLMERCGDETSYVFGFGCSLYQAITGYAPLTRLKDRRTKGDCFGGFLTSYRKKWRGENAAKPNYPTELFEHRPALKAFLEQCLHPDRVARLSDPKAMVEALHPVLKELGPAPEPKPVPPPSRLPVEPAQIVVEKNPRKQSLNKVAFGGVALALLLVAFGIKGISNLSSRESAVLLSAEPETVVQAMATTPAPELTPSAVEVEIPELPQKTPEPVEVVEAPPPPEPAKPTLETKPTPTPIIQVYVKPPTDKGPPIEVAYRSSADSPWNPVVDKEVEVASGHYTFRFHRPDYSPIYREVDIEEGKSAAFVSGPEPREWKPSRKLVFLFNIEAAFERRDLDIVARVFAKPRNATFEWEGHSARFEALQTKWFSQLKHNTLPSRIGSVALSVRLPALSDQGSPVEVLYRQKSQDRWHPLKPGALVQPGGYELRFQRADYQPIYKSVKVISGKQSMELSGPSKGDWIPKPHLEDLMALEQLLAEGDLESVTARLAKPQPGTFEFDGHARRMHTVRDAWYQSLIPTKSK